MLALQKIADFLVYDLLGRKRPNLSVSSQEKLRWLEQSFGSTPSLAQILSSYVDRVNPGYAVLVNGPWGSGKTWLIKKLILARRDTEFVYVTLNGARSARDIDQRIFASIYPALGSRRFSAISKAVLSTLKSKVGTRTGGDELTAEFTLSAPSAILLDPQRRAAKRVYIFDDLERAAITPVRCLAHINSLVEHSGARVIIIGNVTELRSSVRFSRVREKVIGKQFNHVAQTSDAFDAFVSGIPNKKLRDLMSAHKDSVVAIYGEQKYSNLRTLKHAIDDYQSFFSYLPTIAQENSEFQTRVIGDFLRLSIAIKRGDIQPGETEDYTTKQRRQRVQDALNKEKLPKKKVDDATVTATYFSAGEPFPNNQIYDEFFRFGNLSENTIKDAMCAAPMLNAEEASEWQTLWRVLDVSPDDFTRAWSLMSERLRKDEYRDEGILKHVLGIGLFYVREKMVRGTESEFYELVKASFERLNSAGKFEFDLIVESDPFLSNYSRGFAYLDHDNPLFKQFEETIKSAKLEKRRTLLRADAKLITQSLSSGDADKFSAMLKSAGNDNRDRYKEPFLSNIDPKEFVSAYLKCPSASRRTILYAMNDRYSYASSYPRLVGELGWLEAVCAEIDQIIDGAGGPDRYQLKLFNDQALKPGLAKLKQLDSTIRQLTMGQT